MKPAKKHTEKKVPTKGIRLKWQPLSEVKPVNLTPKLTAGNLVVITNTTNRNNHLVP